MNQGEKVYTINHDVYCLKCGHKGALQVYGDYVVECLMTPSGDIAGNVPYECSNCGNKCALHSGGCKSDEKAFITIHDARKILIDTFSKTDEVFAILKYKLVIYVHFISETYDDDRNGVMRKLEKDKLLTYELLDEIYDIRLIHSSSTILKDGYRDHMWLYSKAG